MQKEFELELKKLHILCEFLKDILNDNCVIILKGDLASGKTTFVKAYAKFIGLDDLVTSPTFSLQSIYSDKIYHYDIYNKGLDEFISLGMLEEFEKNGLHFVEWGDDRLKKILDEYGFENIVINIEKKDKKRLYKVES